MARKSKKNGFDTSMLLKYGEKLDALGGSDAVKRAVGSAMKATKQALNTQLDAAVQPGNLPAGGKYSTGDTRASISRNMTEEWAGNIATLPLGFDLKKNGLTSIFLMHGTPKMAPVPELKELLYGNTGKRIARKEQEAALRKVIERLGK